MASVYHKIINGRNSRVDTSSWLVFPRTKTRAKRSVIRKKRTRDNQLSHAATFCVISIRGELVGPSAVQRLKVSMRPELGRGRRAVRREPPSQFVNHNSSILRPAPTTCLPTGGGAPTLTLPLTSTA